MPWALLSYSLAHTVNKVTITAVTSTPCHLYAHWSTIEPTKTLLPRIRRGLPSWCYPTWAYLSQGHIHQTEPGNTLTHTFSWNNWWSCLTLWIILSAQTDLTIKDSTGPLLKYHNLYTFTVLPLLNDSFEHWTLLNPDSWTIAGDGYALQEAAFVRSGDYALKMSGWGDHFKSATQDLDAIPYRGYTITLKAWGKQPPIWSSNRRFNLETNGTPPIYQMAHLPYGPTYGEVTLTGLVPMNATYIRVICGAWAPSDGNYWPCYYDYLTLYGSI